MIDPLWMSVMSWAVFLLSCGALVVWALAAIFERAPGEVIGPGLFGVLVGLGMLGFGARSLMQWQTATPYGLLGVALLLVGLFVSVIAARAAKGKR